MLLTCTVLKSTGGGGGWGGGGGGGGGLHPCESAATSRVESAGEASRLTCKLEMAPLLVMPCLASGFETKVGWLNVKGPVPHDKPLVL